jgi:hypothetical protein
VKHAGPNALDKLDDLLCQLREYPQLTERKRGTFYIRASAFLHFHEDPSGLFADLKVGREWERLPANTAAQRNGIAKRVADLLVTHRAAHS